VPRKPKNISGKKFHNLLVLDFVEVRDVGPRSDRNGRKTLAIWNCLCDCGSITEQVGTQLTSGKTKRCGHCATYGTYGSQDLTGKKFGTFTVVSRADKSSSRWKSSRHWNCVCECGGEVIIAASVLASNSYKICKPCKEKWLPKPNGKLTPVRRVKGQAFLWVCECGGEIICAPGKNNCGCVAFGQLRRDHRHAAQKVYNQYVKDAVRRGKSFDLTEDEFFGIITRPCHYTGAPPSKLIKTQVGDFYWNGVDRKDNSKGYTLDNCLPCSEHANWAKETRNYDDFIEWLKQVAAFWKDK
jgi:hypothetical protein